MRKLYLLTGLLLIAAAAFAQPLPKGGKQINFGVGFIDGIPLHVGVDFAVHDNVSIGPEIDFDLGGFDWMRVWFRGDYHWNALIGIPDNWDFYSGARLGPKFRFGGNGNAVGFEFQVDIGGRYYWSDWGVGSELGLGTDINWRFGLSKKF